jgi:hypothetical protein
VVPPLCQFVPTTGHDQAVRRTSPVAFHRRSNTDNRSCTAEDPSARSVTITGSPREKIPQSVLLHQVTGTPSKVIEPIFAAPFS